MSLVHMGSGVKKGGVTVSAKLFVLINGSLFIVNNVRDDSATMGWVLRREIIVYYGVKNK